jgi:hypothetical protein
MSALQAVPDPGEEDDRAIIEAARLEVARARRDLPARDPDMFDCYLGRLANTVCEFSEADPLAVLGTLAAACGVWLGPGPHVQAGDDRHPLLLWVLINGKTAAGRKGASWSTARRVFAATDPAFTGTGGNVRSGLTSGEGLAELFALADDPPAKGEHAGPPSKDDPEAPPKPPGAAGGLPPGDLRLLVFEPEWAAVMSRMRREGSALSAMLRAAWEGGDLSTLNVKARHAPESHVGIVAHITPGEFAAKVSASDMAGGTYNRFLPLYVARSRFLPLSTGADPALIAEQAASLAHRLRLGQALGAIRPGPDAERLWRRLYVEFGSDPGESDPRVEQFISRAAPNCLRLAAIYAALDGTDLIRPDHLRAAAALIRYAIASARAVFNTDPDLSRLADYITEAGPAGRTKDEIRNDHFQRNKKAAEIDALLATLTRAAKITQTTRPPAGGRGKPATVYTAPGPVRG